MDMFRDPKVWRRVVNERLFLLKQDLAYFRGPDAERSSLEHRVRLLVEELKRLDEEEEERGTQWLDPDTGRSADM
ncbi:MAG: hypothetical protein HY533_06850 [Chloroflexi bacterium]|nr:hypothetical protein [Chloroflexota bacterium]